MIVQPGTEDNLWKLWDDRNDWFEELTFLSVRDKTTMKDYVAQLFRLLEDIKWDVYDIRHDPINFPGFDTLPGPPARTLDPDGRLYVADLLIADFNQIAVIANAWLSLVLKPVSPPPSPPKPKPQPKPQDKPEGREGKGEEPPLEWPEEDRRSIVAIDPDVRIWFEENRQRILAYPKREFPFLPIYQEFFASVCDWNYPYNNRRIVAPGDNLTDTWDWNMCMELQSMIREHTKEYIRQLYTMMNSMLRDVMRIRKEPSTFKRFDLVVQKGGEVRRDRLFVASMLIAEFNMVGRIAMAWYYGLPRR